jgi:manganese/zinc/iron transport system permease protein
VSGIALEIQAIAVLVAVSCALVGVFLVLRRMALLSDAISHTVLLGIVLGFFATRSLTSPLLLIAATATGVLTVGLVEVLRRTRLVKEDAAIGLVFPALFSVAVILIARYADKVHLDTDAVLLGELAFAPFRRLELGGIDVGPITLWLMAGVLALDLAFVLLFYKELKLTTFDAALAASLGIAPAVVQYAFMTLVSVTAVGAFDAVGSILVVALMIAPPSAAYLLSDRLPVVIGLSALLGALAAIGGFWTAWLLDASFAGAIAGAAGAIFLIAFLLAPERGVVALARRRRRQRIEFAVRMLTIHLHHHEGSAEAEEECRADHLHEHLRWTADHARRIVAVAERDELVRRAPGGLLELTPAGRATARRALIPEASAAGAAEPLPA